MRSHRNFEKLLKFPPARIKKIMQCDEDVGKIAVTTPFVLSKSLEMFLQELCDKATRLADERGSRVITPSYLKHLVHNNEQLDFLKDIFEDVPDLPAEPEQQPARGIKRETANADTATPKRSKKAAKAGKMIDEDDVDDDDFLDDEEIEEREKARQAQAAQPKVEAPPVAPVKEGDADEDGTDEGEPPSPPAFGEDDDDDLEPPSPPLFDGEADYDAED
mmetsp:Transcript_7166/g.26346  ORF Transcript_7166/g.26346 Transcript_7166/m.26346 type:complete len:219 (-) Transcript_7166:138-794(-)